MSLLNLSDDHDGVQQEVMQLWTELKDVLKIVSQHPLMGAIAAFIIVDAMGRLQIGWDEKTYTWRSSTEGPPPA